MNEQDREDPTPDNGDSPSAPLLPRRIYHAWWIVLVGAGALLVVELVQSHLIPDLPSVRSFFDDLADLLVTLSWWLGSILAIVLAPILGALVDRRGSRSVIVIAFTVGAAAFVIGAWLPDQRYAFALLVLTMGVLALTAHIAIVKAVAVGFVRNRGKALALVLMGISLASLFPLLLFSLSFEVALYLEANLADSAVNPDVPDESGTTWRGGALFGSILLALVAIPLFLVLRHKPEGANVGPDDNVLDRAGESERPVLPRVIEPVRIPGRSILLSRPFLLFLGALSLQPLAFNSLHTASSRNMLDFLFIFSLRFFGEVAAATVLIVMAVMFLTGALSDRYSRRYVVAGLFGLQLMCAIVFLFATNQLAVLLLIVATGSGLGLYGAANLALLAEFWGTRNLGFLLGAQIGAGAMVSLIWSIVTPFVFVRSITRSGEMVVEPLEIFFTSVIPLAIALVLILLMKRPQYRNTPAEREAQAAA